ncbi:hypothetical protein LTR67_008399 [Exophiala xenobiotica]
MARPLDGKVAIVTGGSRGIGAAIATELARRGASIVLTYVSSAKGALATLHQIEAVGGPKAVAVQADCSDAEVAARKVVAEAVKGFGPGIDIIVNNAANGNDHSLEEVDTPTFDIMFHTNVLFPLALVKESAPYLRRCGRIVNISSAGARARKYEERRSISTLVHMKPSHRTSPFAD